MLLQTLGQEVLVVDYQLHKACITGQYCVNKARPLLHGNGKWHLAKQLRKAEGGDKKSLPEAQAKVKYEVLATPRRWQQPARPFPTLAVARCATSIALGIFRPSHQFNAWLAALAYTGSIAF